MSHIKRPQARRFTQQSDTLGSSEPRVFVYTARAGGRVVHWFGNHPHRSGVYQTMADEIWRQGSTTQERALRRYADTIYRLALLLEADPARAAQATARAFTALDWSCAGLDDRLEERLVAALLLPRRRRFSFDWRRRLPASLPPSFWRLPAHTRLLLGLRLNRGYGVDAIAELLGHPAGEVRALFCDGIATLAGDTPDQIDAECRRSRAERLDAPGADHGHHLSCAACLAAAPRWEHAERALTGALSDAMGASNLPRATVEEITMRLRGMPDAETPGAGWRAPAWREAALAWRLCWSVPAWSCGRHVRRPRAPARRRRRKHPRPRRRWSGER